MFGIKKVVKTVLNRADAMALKTIPVYRAKKKYTEELNYWKGEFKNLSKWYNEGSIDWWGIIPPSSEKKASVSDLWATNAVMTMHHIRPTYLEELQIESYHLKGKKVLEVGCGPLAPILQFSDCIRHGLDPLINVYIESGWPLYDYDVKFVNAKGEAMPYVDSYFDVIISVNALDHVDDFRKVASEIQRVLKVGGELYFEIEYHHATVTEPVELNDTIVLESFSSCDMKKIIERGKRDMFEAIVNRFGLIPDRFSHFTNDEKFVTWHGRRTK